MINAQLDTLVPICPMCSSPLAREATAIYRGIYVDFTTMLAGSPTKTDVHLTLRQAQVLRILIDARGGIVPYATFEDLLWSSEQALTFSCRCNVNVHVHRLRRKLDIEIRNVNGVGYGL